MESLVITVSWEYFLGIMAALIGIAWYSSRRFSSIETDVSWLKEGVKDLKLTAENATKTPVFQTQSPVALTDTGNEILVESGLKKHIDENVEIFMTFCRGRGELRNPYDIQTAVFELFDNYSFPQEFEDTLKNYAFNKGISLSLLKRIGAIYFRDICIDRYGMNPDDIDKFDPATSA